MTVETTREAERLSKQYANLIAEHDRLTLAIYSELDTICQNLVNLGTLQDKINNLEPDITRVIKAELAVKFPNLPTIQNQVKAMLQSFIAVNGQQVLIDAGLVERNQ